MKGLIYYIAGHAGSEKQAEESFKSFERYGWDVELVEGVTPDTIDESEFPWGDLKGGRLQSFLTSEPEKYLIKKSCIFNNLRHYVRVIKEKRPIAFIEHDALCTGPPPSIVYSPFLFLAFETALKQKVFEGNRAVRDYKLTTPITNFTPFPSDYPLRYYKDSIYRGAQMTPGTVAYIVTPLGAKKLLVASKENGMEQSDFHINSMNIDMAFMYPSPVKYNINLNTSHTL